MSQRPHSINELAKMALENIYDDKKDMKYHLRMAEKYSKEGKQFVKEGQLENAFMAYARAATLILERLPYHRDYQRILTPEQRHYMSLVSNHVSIFSTVFVSYLDSQNGNDMLERLTDLKSRLLEQHSQWKKDHSNESDGSELSNPLARKGKEPQRGGSLRRSHKGGGNEDHRRVIAEERQAWEDGVDEDTNSDPQEHLRQRRPNPSPSGPRPPNLQPPMVPMPVPGDTAVKRDAAVAAARLAATGVSVAPAPAPSLSTTEHLNLAEQNLRFQKQQEEMRQREDEILKRRERAKREQEAIAARQQEADEAERRIRQTINENNPGITLTAPAPSSSLNHVSSTPDPSPSSHPQVGAMPGGPSPHFVQVTPAITPLSLSSPSKYEDSSTDSESIRDWYPKQTHAVQYPKPLTRATTIPKRCVPCTWRLRVNYSPHLPQPCLPPCDNHVPTTT